MWFHRFSFASDIFFVAHLRMEGSQWLSPRVAHVLRNERALELREEGQGALLQGVLPLPCLWAGGFSRWEDGGRRKQAKQKSLQALTCGGHF